MTDRPRRFLTRPAFFSPYIAALLLLIPASASAQGDVPVPEAGAGAPEAAPAADAPAADAPAEVTEEVAVAGEEVVDEEVDERLVSDNINLDGGVGFHKIASANAGDVPLMFRAAFLGEFSSATDVVRTNDSNTRAGGRVLIQGTLTEFLAVNLGLSARSNVNSFGQPRAMLSQGDMNLGVLGFYPVTDYLTLGGDLNLFVPADFGSAGLSGTSISVRPRLLASLDTRPLTDNQVALDVHFNMGYKIDRSDNSIDDNIELTRIERFAYDVNAYDLFELGLGAEYDLPYVSPFIGFWMGLPVNGADEAGNDICAGTNGLDCYPDVGIGAAPKVLSIGAKAEPVENFGLHAGVDLGLTSKDAEGLPVTLPYNIIFGLSWTIDPRPKIEVVEVEKVVEKEKIVKEAPAMGYLVGSVVDKETNESVRLAVVEYLGQDLNPQATLEANGRFRSYGFEPGTKVKIRVSHPDYKPTELEAEVQDGEIPLSIALEALPKIAKLNGRVVDDKDKSISDAVVTISGDEGTFTVRVDAGGNFLKDIKAGKYTIAAKADGYLTRGRDIEVKANDNLNLDIVLISKPKKSVVKLLDEKIQIEDKIFFETGEAKIQSRSNSLLDQVAAVLLENPQLLKVRIEGHTDDKGSKDFNLDLSQRRAEAVRKYLIDQGISPDRLEAKGFGPTRPILPNTSNRNRALNRRVEFNIVDQKPKTVEGGL